MTKYFSWTESEISSYLCNFVKPELGPAYLSAGISANQPHKRVEYLVKKLNLSEAERKEIAKKLKEQDESSLEKPSILSSLEERAMRKFGIHTSFFRREKI